MIGLESSDVQLLVAHPAYDLTPSWSPDGTYIAFVSLRDSDWDPANPGGAPFAGEIYLVYADGSGLRRLTDAPEHDQSPSWSPDGRTVLFSREVGGSGQIFRIQTDGTGLERVRSSDTYDGSPVYSPDGSKIAFYATRADSAHILVMDANGRGPTQVTHRFPQNYYPAWSPDGDFICYTALVGDQWDIYAVHLASGEETAMVTDPARDEACAWKPTQ